ncbi:ATP-dependent DNA helicase [Paucibacter sp. KCTC 42545]|uniref:ATP-dependent DNA helicase n=1 Tax=Paucibacter sp. KCTC 42545 TaxID=1768242 RepID=UPI000733BB3B|nr:ATP-dependent DNA helicase [Paucibacter sp. KCTC 42545]ALT77123.1 ATP-dependent DNA helicase [Paucibacter sp. KCTC 42545]
MSTSSESTCTVAVRSLCEFTAKRGDLDLRFTPSPTAQEGMAGHALVAERRGTDYQTEVSLSGCHGALQVRGRADGFDAKRQRLEEIKTFKGRLEAMPANHRALHWAQLKIYGALLCAKLGLDELELALIYFDVNKQTETALVETHSRADLQAFFSHHCDQFLAWAEQEAQHLRNRDAALTALTFPHAQFRSGQRELAAEVYRAAVAGRCLMAQAPTGLGKTLATLFPLLKAAPGQRLDKIFFLTAKTSGRALALDSLATVHKHAPGLPLRSLELVAKEKACEHPDKACHGESCPLAEGFYERLPQARQAAIQHGTLDRETLRRLGQQYSVCPYYLGQEMARWADVLVGDYNYYFDQSAMLHSMTEAYGWRVAVLVDEAHNLVSRARAMYSASARQDSLTSLRHSAPAQLKKPLDRLKRCWTELGKSHDQPFELQTLLPDKLLQAMHQAVSALGEYFQDHPAQQDEALQRFYFEALQFTRMAEAFDANSLCDIEREDLSEGQALPGGGAAASSFRMGGNSRAKPRLSLNLRNVVPAPFLRQRFLSAHTVTLFSATLQPAQFYTDLLGLPDGTPWVEVASPFQAEQLQVHIAGHISTRYQHRQTSLRALVDVMAQAYAAMPGNYLAFFSSHSYLQEALQCLQTHYPDLPCWAQGRRMSEAEQQSFLARFTPESCGIAFAVLGGSFSEGIDLPGARLIGAFIATLGLPQVNPVNEQFKRRLDELLCQGYDYTYVYPGMQKVVQAAGRVIRTVHDQGVIHLLDDRYLRREVQALLPSWWQITPA